MSLLFFILGFAAAGYAAAKISTWLTTDEQADLDEYRRRTGSTL